MMDTKYFLIMLFSFVLISIFSGIIGSNLESDYNIIDRLFFKQQIGIEGLDTIIVDDIINECDFNKGRIDKKLECIKEHVKRFYIYKIRDDDENVSFELLMNDGGDCANWEVFWEYVGKSYNYDITPIYIGVNENTAHVFSILSNSQGYCTVDQTKLNCFIYG